MDVSSKWNRVITAISRGHVVSATSFGNALQSGEPIPNGVREWLATKDGMDWIRKHIRVIDDPHRPGGSGRMRNDGLLFLFMRHQVIEHLDEHGGFKRGFLKQLKENMADSQGVSFKTIEHFYEKRMPKREEVHGWYRQFKKDRSSKEAVSAVAQQFALHEVEVRRRLKDLL